YDINQLRGNIPVNDKNRYLENSTRLSAAFSELGCVQLTLSVNYRNSREIATHYMRLLNSALIEAIRCETPAFEAGEVVTVDANQASDAHVLACEAVRKLRRDYNDDEVAVISLVAKESVSIVEALRRAGIPSYSTIGNGHGVLVTTPEIVRGHERKAVVVF